MEAALREAAARLGAVSDSARLDAEILLAQVLGCGRGSLLARGDEELASEHRDAFDVLTRRRSAGEPVAYITGQREFWSLPFAVTPEVLIPRPETELLVEWGLQVVGAEFGYDSPERRAPAIADLGTGCGAVAIALARERPRALVVATDSSEPALALAQANAERLGARNVDFVAGSWFEALDSLALAGRGRPQYNLVVSNPPYVAEGDPHLDDLRFEPTSALVAGRDGLDALRAIVAGAPAHLEGRGWLLVEHGADQAEGVRSLMSGAGFTDVESRRDLAGHARVTGGQLP